MADKEYIERDAALNAILGEPPDAHYPSWYAGKIEEIPAADVVEVVRCKDCVWWEARTCGSCIGRCENPRNGLVSEYSESNDFCSYGERKEQT